MKYLKAFLITIGIFLLITLISSTLSYFNIINDTFNNILKIISIIGGTFIGGIYIGLKSENKGYLEGIKIGGIILLFMISLSYLGFDNNFNIMNIIYYLVLFIISIVGSIIGINKKKETK